MIIWKKWETKKLIDGKYHQVYHKGLFLFGFIPLYLTSEVSHWDVDYFKVKK